MPLDPFFPRLFLRILFPTASGWGYRFNHHYNDGWKLKYRHYTHNTQLSLDNSTDQSQPDKFMIIIQNCNVYFPTLVL